MSIQFQRQLRHNALEFKEYLKELHKWEDEIEQKKPKKKNDINYPIRRLEEGGGVSEAEKKAKLRIYNRSIGEYYKEWEDFDVDREIEKIDNSIAPEMELQLKQENDLRNILLNPTLDKKKADQFFVNKQYKKSEQIYRNIMINLAQLEINHFNQKNLNIFREFEIKILGNLSQNLIHLSKYEEALEICFSILKKEPTFLKNYFRLGKILGKLNKFDKALYYFNLGITAAKEVSEKDEFLNEIRTLKIASKNHYLKFKKSLEIQKSNFFGKRYFCDIKEDFPEKENKNLNNNQNNQEEVKKGKDENFLERFEINEKSQESNQKNIEENFKKYFKEKVNTHLSYDFLKLKNIEGKIIKKKNKFDKTQLHQKKKVTFN